jgi:hypothetical protein
VGNFAESNAMPNTPGMLLRGAALEKLRAEKHEDDTLIA